MRSIESLPSRHVLPPVASLSAVPAVQRKCAACEEKDRSHPIQPRLAVGPAGDRFEREADSIAARVMAMPDPGAALGATTTPPAGGAVQRACSCGASPAEPRARRDAGPETLAASDAELTRGGAPLPAATRSYFEGRMGRDLSGVRVHQGGDASAKNASISARAFTYKNHVWLGASETAGPGFTMAHELAHVMQQTAPGPVGPQRRLARGAHAHAAAPTIRRVGMTPPGDCTQSQYIPLRAAVVFWCKEPEGLDRCEESDSCGQLRLKIRQFQMCARVRQELGDICFGGGDQGHRDQVRSVRRGQANCMEIYRSKCQRRRERERVRVPVAPPVTVPEGRRERSPVRVPVAPPVVAPPVVAPPVVAPPVIAPPVIAPPVMAPPITSAPPRSTRQIISDWARRVATSGEGAIAAAERFIAENPNLTAFIAGAGVGAIIGLIADDATIIGIADDVLVPIIAALEWVAVRALIFGPPALAAAARAP
ncbi:DUF4157 domain-containing protein [Sphingomonas sp. KR3-1]|uniref:eCIS core domain-containing protein n=1 Tax=Sphingomonas sp. KR3-1 TaxID=3156611 RepID=UPI0032B3DD1D